MPFINLIQEQRLYAKREENRARTLLCALTVSIVGVAGVYGCLVFKGDSLSAQRTKFASELQSVEPIVTKIDEANKQTAEFAPKVKTLEDAQLITDRWNRILSHLSTQTPTDVWLTNLRCMATDPAKPIQLTFAGLAKAQGPIGEYILRLQNCADLDKVGLNFTNERTVGQTKGTEFEVTAELTGSAPDKLKDESGGKA